MSAIVERDSGLGLGDLGPDGVRRYKTRCKVLVDSHNNDSTMDISADVYAVDTSKTIKGAGNATLSLVPGENYLNNIFPNDYINIYFDIGDGSGWTRTFFGFVDRVEETYAIGKEGAPSTSYRIVCTDFYKAFDRTQVYFNPHIAGREEFEAFDFAAPNIGGLPLMSKGIQVGGAPSDIIENVILLLIGFGTQFRLPSSYKPARQNELRLKRIEDVRGRISEEAQEKIGSSIESYRQFRQKTQEEVTRTVNEFWQQTDESQRLFLLGDSLGVKADDLEGTSKTQAIKLLTDRKVGATLNSSAQGRAEAGTRASVGARERSLLDSALASTSSLVDVVDVYSFVERRAMDGYIFGQPVWEKQGSIISILRSLSNESVNELFFDLRPLSDDGEQKSESSDPVSGKYVTEPDDKEGNLAEVESLRDGITYVPAVVMREYPFSTVKEVDLSEVELTINDEQGKPEKIGLLTFGDIFSQDPNKPGRKLTYIDNINIPEKVNSVSQAQGVKHLDVAVVSDREVMSTTLGRSDSDHFNLFEFYSDNLLGTNQRFYLRDFLPVITPIHITKNGLRVRTITTRAARFSLGQVINLRQGSQPEEEQEGGTASKELPLVPEGAIDAPVNSPDDVTFSTGQLKSNWNYRQKLVGDADVPTWRWHNGIDITRVPAKRYPSKSTGVPVYAIADGLLYVSAPEGAYKGYGQVVVVKHNFEFAAGPRYSVYAHLSRREVGWTPGKNVATIDKRFRNRFAAKGMPGVGYGGGTKTPITIKRGQLIGYMGNTGTTQSNDHLHFEIDRHFPPYPTMRNQYTPDFLVSKNPSRPSLQNSPGPNATSGKDMPRGFNSCNPVEFFSAQDRDLSALINQGPQTEPDTGAESEQDQVGNEESAQDTNPSKEDEGVEETEKELKEKSKISSTRDSVDTASSRKQIIRWALLQDHWYQHNIEYLSGRVDMRGAPEIRVGYRLDLADRNMSFYVEGVNHSWQFPNNMKSSLQVSRGQPNNPYPVYVLPAFKGMGATKSQRKLSTSRLATYFVTPDPIAIRRSLYIQGNEVNEPGTFINSSNIKDFGSNSVDAIEAIEYDAETRIAEKYDEAVIPAGGSFTYENIEYEDGKITDNSRKSVTTGVDPSAATTKGGVK